MADRILNDIDSKSTADTMKEPDRASIGKCFLDIMENYLEAKNDYIVKNNVRGIFNNLKLYLEQLTFIRDNPNLLAKYGIGIGRMANVPWIAVLNNKVTKTTQEGIYCVYLIKADMSGLYLTFMQGVGIGKTGKNAPSKATMEALQSNAISIREEYTWLAQHGFNLDDSINLADPGLTGKAYEKGTIAYKHYDRNNLQLEDAIEKDLEYLLNAYQDYVFKHYSYESKSWIFQGNPKYYDLEASLKVLKEQRWSVRQHKKAVKKGDRVYIWKSGPDAGILALGTIMTDPAEMEDDEESKKFVVSEDKFQDLETRTTVRIDKILETPIKRDFLKTHTILANLPNLKNPQGTNFTVTPEQDQAMQDLIQNGPRSLLPEPEVPVPEYSKSDALKDLFIEEDNFDYIMNRLSTKKNIILQGAPGVGKTFIAKRLAYYLMRLKDDNRLSMIQFHQSYSYEDFIQGFRPNQDGKFNLRNGIFYEFCTMARQNENKPYVFIIDEINRGNLSKIFGEMLMLIESDKRGSEFSVSLTYGNGNSDKFYIPNSVYLIGTMNTADRSLAMVDYALRRRFGFIDLVPQFKNPKFTEYLKTFGVGDALISRMVERMTSLNETIAEDTKNLGPGYRIGHSYFCPTDSAQSYDEEWYGNVVKSEIKPLLNEYWFDDPKRVADLVSELLS